MFAYAESWRRRDEEMMSSHQVQGKSQTRGHRKNTYYIVDVANSLCIGLKTGRCELLFSNWWKKDLLFDKLLHTIYRGLFCLLRNFKSLLVTLPVANWLIFLKNLQLWCVTVSRTYSEGYFDWPFVISHIAGHQVHRWPKAATTLHK